MWTGLHKCTRYRHKQLQSMIFGVENEITKAHTNSENLVMLAVGTSEISDPLTNVGALDWASGEGPRSNLVFAGLWKSAQGGAGAMKNMKCPVFKWVISRAYLKARELDLDKQKTRCQSKHTPDSCVPGLVQVPLTLQQGHASRIYVKSVLPWGCETS